MALGRTRDRLTVNRTRVGLKAALTLGALGRGLFRLAFLDTRYAGFMASGTRAIVDSASAELRGAAAQVLRGEAIAAIR